MIKRTVAGLETCRLQRAIPRSTRRYRQLHTGFWQHGASALDQYILRPNTTRNLNVNAGPELAVIDTALHQLQSSLLPSNFLEFLYPPNTLLLLRRISPSLPGAQNGARRDRVIQGRPISSSSVLLNSLDRQRAEVAEPVVDGPKTGLPEDVEDPQAYLEDIERGVGLQTLSESQELHLMLDEAEEGSDLQAVVRILLESGGRRQDELWNLYESLPHSEQVRARGKVVRYLVRSHGELETRRAVSIFRQIPETEWTDKLLTTGIILFLRHGDPGSAIDRFKRGLATVGFTGGLEYVLAHAINAHKWETAMDIWVTYYIQELKRRPGAQPGAKRLRGLQTLPQQGRLYFNFRNWLATEGVEFHKKLKASSKTYAAFLAFRRHFAYMALWEPCDPDQAAIILENMNDNELYNMYFTRMFDLWYEKQEPRENVMRLPKIYQQYRQLQNVKPDLPVLRGMFKAHYPTGIVELEQIYDDWMKFYGGLNQWSYEKFLKLYAHRGDIPTVRNLWKRYVQDWPVVLKSPRAFRSTLNVYAQAGDPGGFEKEFRTMREEYGVEPDIDCWNMMLKCYMRVNDYDRVLSCFDEICTHHEPDSFTYAHVMAMTSKKGDLENTLDYFNRSQVARVPVTKEISLSLVVAYCQNNLLGEAEALCVELSERKLTHTAVWNQLLRFYGETGHIEKVYSLLRRMRDFGMWWDTETYELLLHALIRVKQIHPAYALLLKADQENLFPVTAEHFAIVLAGAARNHDAPIVETLAKYLKKTNRPVTFNALVALVEAAVKEQPGEERTIELGRSLLDHFRNIFAATKRETPGEHADVAALAAMPGNLSKLRDETPNVGRAIALLVELRDIASIEELIAIYAELSPSKQSRDPFPPNVTSAIMLAHYTDGNFDKIKEIWSQTWDQVFKASRKRSGEGIQPACQYDLARALNIMSRMYHDLNDGKGLSDLIDQVTAAGFKLTRSNWKIAVRYLADMGFWDRAMYWCENMFMPNWRGWEMERPEKHRRELMNRQLLMPSRQIVLTLQQEWLKMRSMAAWSQDVSVRLSKIQDNYPRLYNAFTTSDFTTLPDEWQVTSGKTSAQDVDRMLEKMPYRDLLKIKNALLRELMRTKNREKRIGTNMPQSTLTPESHELWKASLHKRVRKWANKWEKRRVAKAKERAEERDRGVVSASLPSGDEPEYGTQHNPDKRAEAERVKYWNSFFGRYDQRPHQTPLQKQKQQPRRQRETKPKRVQRPNKSKKTSQEAKVPVNKEPLTPAEGKEEILDTLTHSSLLRRTKEEAQQRSNANGPNDLFNHAGKTNQSDDVRRPSEFFD